MMVEMILANRWDSEAGKMAVDAKHEYVIMCGDKFLRYSRDSSQPEPLQLSDLESEDGFGAKFKLLLAPGGLVVGSAERSLVAK